MIEIESEKTQKLKEIIAEREKLEQKSLFFNKLNNNELDVNYYNELVDERWNKEKFNERTKADIYREEGMKDIRCSSDQFLMNTFEKKLENKRAEQVWK